MVAVEFISTARPSASLDGLAKKKVNSVVLLSLALTVCTVCAG